MNGNNNSQNYASPILPTNVIETDEEKTAISQRQIIKNVFVLCIGFVLFFTAYNGLSMLQSTMNQNGGIGVASQAIIYAGFCISALLLPKYAITKLGCKRALLVSMSCYIPYVAANFYFNWVTMVPSAILVGLAASVLWSSSCTYINESAELYSSLSMEVFDTTQEHFKSDVPKTNCCSDVKSKTSFTNCEEQMQSLQSQCLDSRALDGLDGNLDIKHNNGYNNFKNVHSINVTSGLKTDLVQDTCISVSSSEPVESSINSNNSKHSSCVVTQELTTHSKEFQISSNYQKERSNNVSSVTARFFGIAGLATRSSDIWSNLISYYILQDNSVLDNITESGNCSCGASFCNLESICFEHNLAEPSQEMRNILTGVSVILAILPVILVLLFLDELKTDKKPVKFSLSLALATCKFSIKKEAILLLPLSTYIGLQQGFYIGDFTKSYIACAWGVYHVGLVSAAYGMAAGISSTISGILVKYVGRLPVMLAGGVINAGINIYLLIWNPLPEQPDRFFLSAALLGIAVGIFWSQLRAFYGVVFKNDVEAAFAGFYLWDSIGYCLSFSYSNYICTSIKIYIMLAVSTTGVIGYVWTESIFNQRNSQLKN